MNKAPTFASLGRPMTAAERQRQSRARRAEDGTHHASIALTAKAHAKAQRLMERDGITLTAAVNQLLERSRA